MKFSTKVILNDEPYKDIVLNHEELLLHAREIARSNAHQETKHRKQTLLPRVKQNTKFLEQAYRKIIEYSSRTRDAVPASEWFLDNYYSLKDLGLEINRSLPHKFERQLPRNAMGEFKGFPRIYGLMVELIEHTDSQLQNETLKEFINAYQVQVPLTSGEIWAIPIMLRIVLLENIRRLTEQILFTQSEREEADVWIAPFFQTEHKPEDWEDILRSLTPEQGYSSAYAERILKHIRDHGVEGAPLLQWIDRVIAKQDTTIEELAILERQRQTMSQVSIGHAISSIHALSAEEWPRFFEQVSLVERVLSDDPANVYRNLDYESRDAYRHQVEKISRRYKVSELVVARKVVARAEEAVEQENLEAAHVGYDLMGSGFDGLERELEQEWGKIRNLCCEFRRKVRNNPVVYYFGSLLIGTCGLFACVWLFMAQGVQINPLSLFILMCGLLIWSSSLVIPFVNLLASKLFNPTFLPKLELREGIPDELKTMVAIPTLFTSVARVEEIIGQIEVCYLANQDNNLHFAVLGDFADASTEIVQGDEDIITAARKGIEALNRKYDRSRFFFFHRQRIFNEAEGVWMGWERKRGKLVEFNCLLLQEGSTSYNIQIGELSVLPTFHYVITLDADTMLPQGSAKKLIGTIAHPLHAPSLSKDGLRVEKGYGILQPRVGVSILSSGVSRFSRIFSGSVGVDPYTTAVSDVYQDLFGEGIFTGKGIYDVRLFHQVTHKAFPENTILSHDLIEGLYSRAGLVTDIELVDGYPSSYLAFTRRLHRWVRGDWQLLPWLFKPIPFISRWKIFDNLRRSLEAPAQMLIILFGLIVLPLNPFVWIGLASLSIMWPLVLYVISQLFVATKKRGNFIQDLWTMFIQFCLQFLFLPYQAFTMLDAIVRSLYRQHVSHRFLLEWETAADAEKRLTVSYRTIIKAMWPVSLWVILVGLAVVFVKPINFVSFIPLGIAWLASFLAAYHLSLPIKHNQETLLSSEQHSLRRWARKMWAFFEEFVCEDDNWLPPDNVQIEPANGVAHRTSPTNIGLALLAILAARDFGYITLTKVYEKIDHTMTTLDRLVKWKGHLYNWYDTQKLVPLEPHYVSTVDSGNLVVYLITLKAGLDDLIEKPVIDLQFTCGIKDTYALMIEAVGKESCQGLNGFEEALEQIIGPDGAWSLSAWINLLDLWPESFLKNEIPDEGKYWASRLDSMIRSFRQETQYFYPWISDPDFSESQIQLNEQLFNAKGLRELAKYYSQGLEENLFQIEHRETIRQALLKIQGYIHWSAELQSRLEKMAIDTNFLPLFDKARQLFSIGYRIEEGLLDKSYYDLLASEARQASFIAIAKGDVPNSHWFRLGRTLSITKGKRSLSSWSGTMFEYVMPLIVMRNYEGTLLDETYRSVVEVQRKYGGEHDVPWGISESAFFAFDQQFNYQYKAFGVPGLGLKRGLIQDLVIAPYASFLALMVTPHQALLNIMRMEEMGFAGRYGLYESVDYTSERIPVGSKFKLVQCFMAHHQGMSFLALNNVMFENCMQRRFHSEALIQASELLLQERLPLLHQVTVKPEEIQSIAEAQVNDSDLDRGQLVSMNSANSPIPITHCISNGQYSVMLTNSGSGFSRFKNIALSRWREDVTSDSWGMYFYIQNLNSGEVWSATHQPCRDSGENYKVTYAPDRVEYIRKDGNITTRTEVVVSPEDQTEIRRISLTNHSQYDRTFEITSYFEVVLARPSEDLAHPAFGNLFIQTEYANEALLASRRPRSNTQDQLWLMHTVATEGEKIGLLQYETDRACFIGRGRNLASPKALDANQPLSNTVGAVLDPMMSLRQRVKVRSGQTVQVSFSIGYADNREQIIHMAEKYRDLLSVNRAFELAYTHSKMELRHLNLSVIQANEALNLGGHLLYLSPCRRDVAEFIEKNRKGQSSLWPYSISGDLPIVLVRVDNAQHLDLVRRLLTIHEYWRLKGLYSDLVILNEDESSYVQAFQDSLRDIVSMGHARDLLNQMGGVFLLQKVHVHSDDQILLNTVARMTFSGEGGSCSVQMRKKGKVIFGDFKNHGISLEKTNKIPLFISKERTTNDSTESSCQTNSQLQFANGYGGFSQDGKEYIIELQDGRDTPLPWINVIANPRFGFQVSESGSGYTWSLNSRENKITPWSNDPILDPSGEAIYLRLEDSGEFWSVTAKPKREKGAYRIRHGQGYSEFEHQSHGLKQTLHLFVPIEDSLKIEELTLENITDQSINISVFYYVEWVMGVIRDQTAPYLVTEYEPEQNSFYTRNTYQEEFAGRIGFITALGEKVKSYTGDRSEFIGRNGSLEDPEALKLDQLSETIGAGLDPCSSIQLTFAILPGETKKITFLLGEAQSRSEAEDLVKLYSQPKKWSVEFDKVTQYWDQMLGTVQVETPDPAMNLLLNRWLLYQTVVCRLWARSGFYQSGGAYGFRDQLQDSMALIYANPEGTRKQIIFHCAHQFVEGDVQHWWHEEKGKGIRTKFSDDLLWLPFVTLHYVERTGDMEIMEESVTFIEDQPLDDGVDERYSTPRISNEQGSVYEHCIRAIEKGLKFGDHGLPLIGSGDWNDGFSKIGPEGKGESVWLGWFLYFILTRFANLCDSQKDNERGKRYRDRAEELKQNLELHGWDGGWYRRAYFDNGAPLGSSENSECQIDAIAQSWAVISGAAKPSRTKDAMLALEHYLWKKDNGVLLLLTPPFDHSLPDPGYIKGYVPGVRENGGQYTHGAVWAVLAYTTMGDGDKAGELFQMLSPIHHARTEHEVNRYKVEPYVVAADVYASQLHVGRGGWTWYTGAAGWMYQAGLEGILGFKRNGNNLVFTPCIPSGWSGYRINYQYHTSRYEIVVENPMGKMTGIERITLDDKVMVEPVILLIDDNKVHKVHITL